MHPHATPAKLCLCLLTALLLLANASFAALIGNGGFEEGFTGWKPFWSRDPQAGTLTLDSQSVHSGKNAARIEHRGEKDWFLEPKVLVAVKPGELFEMEAWVKLDGPGSVKLCVSTYDSQGKAQAWSYGARTISAPTDWKLLQIRFIIPADVTQIQPRIVGLGAATVWVDDVSLEKKPRPAASVLPPTLTLGNTALSLTFDTTRIALDVTDRRTGRHYQQAPFPSGFLVTAAEATFGGMTLSLQNLVTGQEMTATIRLDANLPECVVEVAAKGAMETPLAFPGAFLSQPGEYLVIPLNEGISYPVEDQSIAQMRLITYGGHGICMAFWGVTDGERGQMAIIETPDDAAIHIQRADGRLTVAAEWESQRGQFGYARRLRYVFFDKGGHVAIAKRYRAYAQKIGLFKTLEQKRRENPNVDALIGAVNVWYFGDALEIVKEMRAAGIDRILWSNAQPPETIKTLNALHVLTSRYDIYQDVMNPEKFAKPAAVWINKDWPTEAWPKDLTLNAQGDWVRGWGVEGKDHEWYSCGVVCDTRALGYARQRIPAELKTSPYHCRFIDTTTAAPWRECYDPNHPMTRTESRRAKMELLRYVSEDCKLVTGCETGHDAAVPYLHYFEGMLSLGPYRVPDAGRHTSRIWKDVPEAVAKFQLGQAYRLPLWELVYHDCVVAQWYWGDYNNKLPSLWDKRDLFNVLYGTPPMFMFTREGWQQDKARFVQSYRNTCPYARKVGYSEMTNHRFLTPDRNVQQTTFANGTTVTVNFGDAPYLLPGTGAIPPMGFHATDATAQ